MKKVNISKVILYGIYLVLAANLEIFKVFGEGFFLGNINRYVILSVLFSIFVIAIVLAYKKKIPLFIWLLIFPIVVRMSIAVYYVNVRGFERYNALQYCMCYYCIMLAVPIYYLLRYQVITLRKLMDVSIKLLFVSFFLKSFVSIFNFMTGKIIFPAFIWNDTWYRYGFLRLQPPALANISIVMGMFMYYTEEKKSKRLQYLLCVLVTLL